MPCRPRSHLVDSLDEGLDDYCGNRSWIEIFQILQTRKKFRLETHRTKPGEKPVHPAQRRRTERVSVVGVFKSDEPGPLPLPRLHPGLQGHFQSGLDRRRSVVGKEHPLQGVFRKIGDQFLRQSGSQRMTEAQIGRVVEGRRLPRDGLRDLRAAVTVDVRPDRGIPIQISVPLVIPQPDTFRLHDHQRIVRGIAPRVLRSERMPAMGFV